MPATVPRPRSPVRLRWFLLGAAVTLFVGGASWWMRKSTDAVETGPTAPRSPAALVSAAASPAAMAALNSEAREAAGTSPLPAIAITEAGLPGPNLRLRGRVVPNLPLPGDESLEVVVQACSVPRNGLSDLERALTRANHANEWTEVARVSPLADGTFESPRPRDAAIIRLTVNGDYVYDGLMEFEVDGDRDPGANRVDIPVGVGAHVTLLLNLSGIASGQEIASLTGDPVKFDSTGRSGFGSPFGGRAYEASATIQPGGRAVLRGLQPVPWTLRQDRGDSSAQAMAPFRAAASFQFQPEPGERVTLVVPMERGRPLAGYVLDEAQEPVAGAYIRVKTPSGPLRRARPESHTRRSDKNGYFLFQAVSHETNELTITATGFRRHQLGRLELAPLLQSSGPHGFVLDRGRTLRVNVKAAGGQPAADLSVILKNAGGRNVMEVKTDGEGSAKFQALADGDYTVEAAGNLRNRAKETPTGAVSFEQPRPSNGRLINAADPSNESMWFVSEDVPASALVGGNVLHLQLGPVPMIEGQVLGADPTWPAPMTVAVFRKGDIKRKYAQLLGKQSTFAIYRGRDRFSGQLPPGSYEAQAISGLPSAAVATAGSAKVHRSDTVAFEVKVGAVDLNLTLRFPTALGLSGFAKLESGAPVAGLRVRARRKEKHFSAPAIETTTDSAGRFAFDGLSPGTYSVRSWSARYVTPSAPQARIREGVPGDVIDLVVVGAGAIHVEARRLAGDIDPDAQIWIIDSQSAPVSFTPIRGDPEWSGAYGPLSPGVYTAIWDQEQELGGRLLMREQAVVEAGKLTTVHLRETGEATSILKGRVLSGGAPAAGISVSLSDELGYASLGQTGADGRFRLECLVQGKLTLSAGTFAYQPAAERTLEVHRGTSETADLHLPTGGVEGTFAGDTNARASNEAALRRAGAGPSEPPMRRARGSSDGSFRIPYLPDGRYELYAVGGELDPSEEWEPQIILVENGQLVRGVQIRARH